MELSADVTRDEHDRATRRLEGTFLARELGADCYFYGATLSVGYLFCEVDAEINTADPATVQIVLLFAVFYYVKQELEIIAHRRSKQKRRTERRMKNRRRWRMGERMMMRGGGSRREGGGGGGVYLEESMRRKSTQRLSEYE